MIYKLLFAGDLHKRNKDISTIKGYVRCVDAVQDSLIDLIKEQDITHFIHLGDWYDRGYVDDIAAAIADTSVEYYINKLVNGNFYGVLGNHIRLRMDSNPELMLIQPHSTMKSRKPIKREYPLIQTPNCFVIGNVQISLVHHNHTAQTLDDYDIVRLPNIKYHIACVHDAKFVPNSRLAAIQYPPTVSLDSQIADKLSCVDLCICGDIHVPIGMFNVTDATKMIIPGSLTNTSASIRLRHSTINLPIIVIDDEKDTVSFYLHKFDLKTNMLTFDEKKNESLKDKLNSLRGNSIKKLYPDSDFESIMASGISSLSFSSFLKQQNYTEGDRSLIKQTIIDPTNLDELMKIHYKDISIPDI